MKIINKIRDIILIPFWIIYIIGIYLFSAWFLLLNWILGDEE